MLDLVSVKVPALLNQGSVLIDAILDHHELDEGLQTAFDGFLEERGVDQALGEHYCYALRFLDSTLTWREGDFIVSYVELKEQKVRFSMIPEGYRL